MHKRMICSTIRPLHNKTISPSEYSSRVEPVCYLIYQNHTQPFLGDAEPYTLKKLILNLLAALVHHEAHADNRNTLFDTDQLYTSSNHSNSENFYCQYLLFGEKLRQKQKKQKKHPITKTKLHVLIAS